MKFRTTIPALTLTTLCLLQGAATKELRFCIAGDPKGFDPLHTTEENGETIRYLTAGVLIRVNRATDAVEPVLAETWKVTDGGKGIQFHLRAGLKFSDGTPLTAKDVERTLLVALDPKQASELGDQLRQEKAAPKITVSGDRDITLRYDTAKPSLDRVFDGLAIIPAKTGQQFSAAAGPFSVVEYKPASYVKLAKNPNFPFPAKLDSIRIDIQQNREIEISRFLKGELQIMSNLEPEAFDRVKAANPKAARNLGPALSNEFLWFNQAPARNVAEYKRTWFRSAAFRHAISASIHRDDLVRIVYKGYAHPASGPFSPANQFCFNKALKPHAFDAAAAARFLKEDGFTNRNGVLFDKAGHAVEFSLITQAGNKVRERMAALLQDDLKKIGIRVNIVPLDFGSLIDRIMKTLDYEACLLGYGNVDIDPVEQNNVWMSSGPLHAWWPAQKTPATDWEKEIDSLMLAQTADANRANRKKAFDRVQQIAYDLEPIIYLVNRDFLSAVSPAVKGTQPVAVAPQILWNVERLSID